MRNVIVTGGSRGLGLGIARKLIASGFRVIVIARKESAELNAAKAEVELVHPGSLHFVPSDLAELEGIPAMVKKLRKDFGAALWTCEQRRHEHRWGSGHDVDAPDRAGGAAEHDFADGADQACGAAQ